MGYALFSDGEVALAQGTHEYRPYGQSIIGIADQFRERHFRRGRLSVPPGCKFVGYFASLSDVNRHLDKLRTGQAKLPKDDYHPPIRNTF